MKVRDLMTTDVKSCSSDTNLAAAASRMWEGDCGALPVVDDDGKFIGMIADRDICMAVATRPPACFGHSGGRGHLRGNLRLSSN